jgi:hypothetical protein
MRRFVVLLNLEILNVLGDGCVEVLAYTFIHFVLSSDIYCYPRPESWELANYPIPLLSLTVTPIPCLDRSHHAGTYIPQ